MSADSPQAFTLLQTWQAHAWVPVKLSESVICSLVNLGWAEGCSQVLRLLTPCLTPTGSCRPSHSDTRSPESTVVQAPPPHRPRGKREKGLCSTPTSACAHASTHAHASAHTRAHTREHTCTHARTQRQNIFRLVLTSTSKLVFIPEAFADTSFPFFAHRTQMSLKVLGLGILTAPLQIG